MNKVERNTESAVFQAYLNECIERLEKDRQLLRTYLNMDISQLISPDIWTNLYQINSELVQHKTQLISMLNTFLIK